MTLFGYLKMSFMKELTAQLKTKSYVVPLDFINSVFSYKSLDARKALLKRACQKGDLIRIRSGLYLLGEEYRKHPYNSFEIANHIRKPSYVSLESAMSHYGLIPEAVYTITSVTPAANLELDTPIGHFSFSHLKTTYFNFDFYHVREGDDRYLLATPLKALMDYIILKKKNYKIIEECEEDLRFDIDELRSYKEFVNKTKIDQMLKVYKSYRLQTILKDLRKKL